MSDDAGTPRREILDLAMRAGVAACAAGMGVPVALYLLPAGSRGPHDAMVPAGPAASFEPGTARMIQSEGRPILVLSLGDGRYRAFSAICTHLGCIVKWDGATKSILCPCHAGSFGTDGRVTAGPPPRPLPSYDVVVSDGELKVKL